MGSGLMMSAFAQRHLVAAECYTVAPISMYSASAVLLERTRCVLERLLNGAPLYVIIMHEVDCGTSACPPKMASENVWRRHNVSGRF